MGNNPNSPTNQQNSYVGYSPNPNYFDQYSKIGPYGVRFGEEGQVRQKERKQYKSDLDYLVGLRKPYGYYGEMSQKEWEEYNRKINYMNDVNDLLTILII